MPVVSFICSFIIAFTTSWKLSLVLTATIPFVGLSGWFLTKAFTEASKQNKKAYEKAGGVAEEVLYKIKTVSSFGNFKFEIERFNKLLMDSLNAGLKSGIRSGIGFSVLFFTIFASYGLAIWYGSKLLFDKEYNSNSDRPFKAGDVMTVLFNIIFGALGLGTAAPNFQAINEACVSAYDFFELKERKPKIDLSTSTEKPDKDSINAQITFNNINFTYPSNKDKQIFNNLSFRINPNEKTAIVGESGCGKSTIINLIERLYDVDSGSIEVDKYNIKDLDLDYWRSLIGFVPQEPVLFNQSIEENIIFGRDNITDEDIKEVN